MGASVSKARREEPFNPLPLDVEIQDLEFDMTFALALVQYFLTMLHSLLLEMVIYSLYYCILEEYDGIFF